MKTAVRQPIGIFDSGLGGLTVLKSILEELPQYDYLYFGDSARTPYGTRSYEVVYKFTLECVTRMFEMGCSLVILACNTASAKALRTIQQKDLPMLAPDKKLLGVLRPTTETVGNYTATKHVGILGTSGTVLSDSYPIEIKKYFPDVKVFQQACPMWVPLVENNEHLSEGADYFVKKDIDKLFTQNADIDTVILGCTHYPLLEEKIRKYLPQKVRLLFQGQIVAQSLKDYLKRHPEMEERCTKDRQIDFMTTDTRKKFNRKAETFFGAAVNAQQVIL